MSKRVVSLVILVCLCISFLQLPAFAASGFENFKPSQQYADGMFTDVAAGSWYVEGVKASVNLGLLKGTTETTFDPDGSVTIATAITMAARVHSIYSTGSESFVQGSPWYLTYVDYAAGNGITGKTYADYDKAATRAEFAEILAGALPDAGFEAINTVESGAIPDVPMNAAYTGAVYKLYRAGILTGNDAAGTFTPDSNISRNAAAAIVARMADPSLRKSLVLQAGGTSATALTTVQLYDMCAPAVFRIEVYDLGGELFAIGSGFFIESTGVAVTNYHVIEDGFSATVTLENGESRKVEGVLAYDIEKDIAIIKVEGSGYTTLTVSTSAVKSGEGVVTLGSPAGLGSTIAEGIISQANRDGYIQTSAPISSGSSGGALINRYGEVVGITTLSYRTGQNLNLAIPIASASELKHGPLMTLAKVAAYDEWYWYERLPGFLDDVVDEEEPNDLLEDAQFLVNGNTVSGRLSDSDIDDFYWLECKTSGTLEITLYTTAAFKYIKDTVIGLFDVYLWESGDDFEWAELIRLNDGTDALCLSLRVDRPALFGIAVFSYELHKTERFNMDYDMYIEFTPDPIK